MKKIFYWVRNLCLATLLSVGGIVAWRARPFMQPYESFNAFFPKRQFLQKVQSPVPEWMQQQIGADFAEVKAISAEAIDRAYFTIEERLKDEKGFDHFVHYRILDNLLYRFTPTGSDCSQQDTQFEKAFKTLLSNAKIPDVDFLLCPMDGIPEPYMDPKFYLMDDPKDQVPILAQSKLKEPLSQQIILIPDLFSLSENWFKITHEVLSINGVVPWEQKRGAAFWRGAYTDKGTPNGQRPVFEDSPRLQICRLSLDHPAQVDAGLTHVEPLADPKIYEDEGIMKSGVSKLDHLKYKYLPVLDGHMCTYPGYQWRLLSDSLCLKQESDQVQWFYRALKPYQHYLPLANDMSDLAFQVAWAEEHQAEVQQMVRDAQQFARENLMIEDDYRYLFLVFQRYAQLQQIDFSSLKKQTQADPQWVCIQYRKRQALLKVLKKFYSKSFRLIGFAN